jgi:hypothetical protein
MDPTAFIIKTVGGPYQQGGLPDLLLCMKGVFVGIEAKNSDTADPTPRQEDALRRIHAAGGLALVARPSYLSPRGSDEWSSPLHEDIFLGIYNALWRTETPKRRGGQ